MKKILTTLLLILAVMLPMAARDTYAHDDSPLPEAAKSIIKKNFKTGISLVKIDRNFGRISEYEVILKDGTEISFDSAGNWNSVETGIKSSVPNGFILPPIRDYVAKNHPKARIVGIEKERKGYQVELSNDIEILFDREGNFKRYED